MKPAPTLPPFHPRAPDAAGIVSWIHIGDLHMTDAGEENHLALQAIVEQINSTFANSVSFVYLPGDVADQGSVAQYEVVRSALDQLKLPWCCIVGDHDVHEQSYANYLAFMAREKHYAFTAGTIRFLALNAFDLPDPGSFTLLPPQLEWVEGQIAEAGTQGQTVVLLLHCYPTDLKEGGERLANLVEHPSVRLIDMGHTHYNELANDGKTLYTATRSTGQIEEGPVGFSVTNIDGAVISWKFFPLNQVPCVMITSPADERFITDATVDDHIAEGTILVRVKAWSTSEIVKVICRLQDKTFELTHMATGNVWRGEWTPVGLADGVYPLTVTAHDAHSKSASDSVRLVLGRSAYQAVERAARDQDNAVGAWPERGLIGTQLGPNKNGRKW